MARNIVICSDGTGNEISENISNVLKLYRVTRKTDRTEPRQLVFYDPGVGTLARPDPWNTLKQNTAMVMGLAFGYGLDDNVLAAYEFLIDNWERGDQIYLFGFSRGAYTVRVLAALIHTVGLLSREQKHLSGAALTAYKQTSAAAQRATQDLVAASGAADALAPDDRASQFARITSTRWPTIRFMGVWDTVASIITPRPDRFFLFSLEELLFTRSNPSVAAFRQAISIDERRRMFRLHPWEPGQMFRANRFVATAYDKPQDSDQVWFAGVHADVGGGYPEAESGLSKYPLLWMIREAEKHGLSVNPQTVNHLVLGKRRKGSPYTYVEPSPLGELHQSLRGAWVPLEYAPKNDRYKEWKARPSFLGYYIPDGEPRFIPPGSRIHWSAVERLRRDPGYRPVNFPPDGSFVEVGREQAIESQMGAETSAPDLDQH